MKFLENSDIFKANTEAIINTVNCVGIMGKGIALQFKEKYPENYKAYKHACDAGKVTIGKMFVTDNGFLSQPRYIINFPTKKHWKGKSDIEFIRSGLQDLKAVIAERGIKSIAIPPLGAGNGGLDWNEVKNLITKELEGLTDVDIQIYEPTNRFNAIKNKTKVALNEFRAMFIKSVKIYNSSMDGLYELGSIEAQKLAYFIGLILDRQDIVKRYKQHTYGPYMPELKHTLNDMAGFYLKGVGDGQEHDHIDVISEIMPEIDDYINSRPELTDATEKMRKIIYGYETTYGMELLGTVHWVCANDKPASLDDIICKVHAWNKRKKAIMSATDIERAYKHLKAQQLIA